LILRRSLGARRLQGPDRKPQLTIGRFVTMEGGEYFFAPSIPAIKGPDAPEFRSWWSDG